MIDPLIEEHRKSFDPENIRDIIDEFFYEQQQCTKKDEVAFTVCFLVLRYTFGF